MSVVSSELGICALEGRIAVGLWFLDTMKREDCQPYCVAGRLNSNVAHVEGDLTRCGVPSCFDYVVRSSLILW